MQLKDFSNSKLQDMAPTGCVCGAGKMVKLVGCLPRKHADLSQESQHSIKIQEEDIAAVSEGWTGLNVILQ